MGSDRRTLLRATGAAGGGGITYEVRGPFRR